jgi:hypothetical protein
LERLFEDIAACAEVIEVTPKFADHTYTAPGSLTLDEGRVLVAEERVRALQIRYRYEEAEWWDTIMLVRGTVRLVRIRQDFESMQ